jgi:hypothetical protein
MSDKKSKFLIFWLYLMLTILVASTCNMKKSFDALNVELDNLNESLDEFQEVLDDQTEQLK